VKYRIAVIAKAAKDLDGLDARDLEAIKKRVLALADNPRPFGSKKLTDDNGYRIRSGDFRIIYRIDDREKTVIIYRIKRRDTAYR
jgi:mRNA interferase RelE/StbE